MPDEDLWIPDTSAIIQLKYVVPSAEQWGALRRLEALVESGEMALERHAVNEVADQAHPDAPGVWIHGVRDKVLYPLDPEFSWVARVMADAGNVVDPNKETDAADPYVLALGLQLQNEGHEVRILTEDWKDRLPSKISMVTACDQLGLQSIRLEEFLAALGISHRPPKPGKE